MKAPTSSRQFGGLLLLLCCSFSCSIVVAASGDGCSLILPLDEPVGWPPTVVVNSSSSSSPDLIVCILAGTYRNVSVSFVAQANSTSSVALRPLEYSEGGAVALVDGDRRPFTFYGVSDVVLSDISFEETADEEGGCLAIYSAAAVTLTGVAMKGCRTTTTAAGGSARTNVESTTPAATSGGGGSFLCVDCLEINVFNSVFDGAATTNGEEGEGQLSELGGIVLLFWSSGNHQKVIIQNSSFSNGIARTGGCIAAVTPCDHCANDASFLLRDVTMSNCSSSFLGGGLALEFMGNNSANGVSLDLSGASVIRGSSSIGRSMGVGGAVSMTWGTTMDSVENSGNDVTVRLSDLSLLHDCSSNGGGGGVAMIWGLSEKDVINCGNRALWQLSDAAAVKNCQSEVMGGGIALTWGWIDSDVYNSGNDVSFILSGSSEVSNCSVFGSYAGGGAIGLSWAWASISASNTGNGLTLLLEDAASVFNCLAGNNGGGILAIWAPEYLVTSGNDASILLRNYSRLYDCEAQSLAGDGGGGLSMTWFAYEEVVGSGNSLLTEMRGSSSVYRSSSLRGNGGGLAFVWDSGNRLDDSGNNAVVLLSEEAGIYECDALDQGGGAIVLLWNSAAFVVDTGNNAVFRMEGKAKIERCNAFSKGAIGRGGGGGGGGAVSMTWNSVSLSKWTGNQLSAELTDEAAISDCFAHTSSGGGGAMYFSWNTNVLSQNSGNNASFSLKERASIYNCSTLTMYIGGGGAISIIWYTGIANNYTGNSLWLLLSGNSSIHDCKTNRVMAGGGGAIFVAWDNESDMLHSGNDASLHLLQNGRIYSCAASVDGVGGGGAVTVYTYANDVVRESSNRMAITLSDNSSIHSSSAASLGGGGGLVFILWDLRSSSVNSCNGVELQLRHNASLHGGWASADVGGGGCAFIGWRATSQMENVGKGIRVSLSDTATVRSCTADGQGGGVLVVWPAIASALDEDGVVMTVSGTASMKDCQSENGSGGAISITPFQNSPTSSGSIVTVRLTEGSVFEDCSASFGGVLSISSSNVNFEVVGVTLRNIFSKEGALFFWIGTAGQHVSGTLTRVNVDGMVGTILCALDEGDVAESSAYFNVTSSLFYNLSTAGENAIAFFDGIDSVELTLQAVVIDQVRIVGLKDDQTPKGVYSGLIDISNSITAVIEVVASTVTNIQVKDVPKSSLVRSLTASSSVSIIDCYLSPVEYVDVDRVQAFELLSSSSIFLYKSTILLTISLSSISGKSFSFIDQSAIGDRSSGSIFVLNSTVSVASDDSSGVDVTLMSSFPSSRFLSLNGSLTYSLLELALKESAEDGIVFMPLQWITLGHRFMSTVDWPPIGTCVQVSGSEWHGEEGEEETDDVPSYADDDGTGQFDDDAGYKVPCEGIMWQAKDQQTAISLRQTIDGFLHELRSQDSTVWACPKGYRLKVNVEETLTATPSYHKQCTQTGSGPNACSLLSFPTTMSCSSCPQHTFSSQQSWASKEEYLDARCISCGAGAVCPGRATIRLLQDYWGSPLLPSQPDKLSKAGGDLETTRYIVVRCPPGYCCVPPNGTQTCGLFVAGELQDVRSEGRCQNLRNGTLCGACSANTSFSLLSDGCVPLTDERVRLPLVLTLISLGCVAYVVFHLWQPSQRQRASLQLLTYFFSTLSLLYDPLDSGASTWDSALISSVISLANGFDLYIRHPSGSPSDNDSSFAKALSYLNAPLWPSATGTDKLVMGLFPIAVMLVSLGVALLISAVCFRQQRYRLLKSTTKKAFCALVVSAERAAVAFYNILLFSYGTLLSVSLKLLSCTAVWDPADGVVGVRSYAGEQRCWTDEVHAELLGVTALVVLVGLPLSVAILHGVALWSRRGRRPLLPWVRRVRLVTAYLEAPYVLRCWWYESALIARRLVLAAVLTQLTESPFARSLTVLCLLCLFVALDSSLLPFRSREDQAMFAVLQVVLVMLAALQLGAAFVSTLDISFEMTASREGVFAALWAAQVALILVGVAYLLFVLVRIAVTVLKRFRRSSGKYGCRTPGHSRCCCRTARANYRRKEYCELDYVVM